MCQKPVFFERLELVSREEHIPQVDENTEKAKWLLVALEWAVTRPGQARCEPYIQASCLAFSAMYVLKFSGVANSRN